MQPHSNEDFLLSCQSNPSSPLFITQPPSTLHHSHTLQESCQNPSLLKHPLPPFPFSSFPTPGPSPRLQPPHPAMTHPGNIPKGPPHPPPPSISHPLWMTSFEVNYKVSKTMLRFCFSRAGISFKSCRFWGLWENSGFSWRQSSSISPSKG